MPANPNTSGEVHKVNSLSGAFFFFVCGLVMIIVGSKLVVDNAVKIASSFNISKEIISATVIAFGTSVPELAVTVAGILKKKSDIAVGNIIGSSIFNIILVMGAAIAIRPLQVSSDMISFMMPLMLVTSAALAVFMRTGYRLVRWEGACLILLYCIFLAYSIRNIL
jgi:cation:H+ antiporter